MKRVQDDKLWSGALASNNVAWFIYHFVLNIALQNRLWHKIKFKWPLTVIILEEERILFRKHWSELIFSLLLLVYFVLYWSLKIIAVEFLHRCIYRRGVNEMVYCMPCNVSNIEMKYAIISLIMYFY